jgi:hypothetical protein
LISSLLPPLFLFGGVKNELVRRWQRARNLANFALEAIVIGSLIVTLWYL